MKDQLFLLKITLFYIKPHIWRRFVVPAGLTLDQLHDVIQITMGWQDSHLYEFLINEKRYIPNLGGSMFDDPDMDDQSLNCEEYHLKDLFKEKDQQIIYTYDLGDCWEHELVVEDCRYENARQKKQLVCLEGERACPPEDVGGLGGFEEFCEAMADPKHEEHESLVEWLGYKYDPKKFNLKTVNSRLKLLQS